MQWTRSAALRSPLTPDVRRRFRSPSPRSCKSPVNRSDPAAAQLGPLPPPHRRRLLRSRGFIDTRHRKSNTHTALRASSLAVFTQGLGGGISLSGRAPFFAPVLPRPHSAFATTRANRTFVTPSFMAASLSPAHSFQATTAPTGLSFPVPSSASPRSTSGPASTATPNPGLHRTRCARR